MTAARIFAVAMIGLQLGAAVAYATEGDWRRTAYWLAAAVLTVAVTF